MKNKYAYYQRETQKQHFLAKKNGKSCSTTFKKEIFSDGENVSFQIIGFCQQVIILREKAGDYFKYIMRICKDNLSFT